MNTKIIFIATFSLLFSNSIAMKKGGKTRQRIQQNIAKATKGSRNIRVLSRSKINDDFEENEFKNIGANTMPSGSIRRMLDGKKGTTSSGGYSGGSSEYSASSHGDDDFFHPTSVTATNSTSVTFHPDESTSSTTMQTVLFSAMIAGAGCILVALFLIVAAAIRKIKNGSAMADKREPLTDDASNVSGFVIIE